MGIRITVLVDDASGRDDLVAEHGLAIHVQVQGRSVLFDAGQSGSALCANAERLGVDLNALSAVVLSHGHYDHSGGVASVIGTNKSAALFLHPHAVATRYGQCRKPPHKSIGVPQAMAGLLSHANERVVWTATPTSISQDLFATGGIPRRTHFEDTGGAFFLDAVCSVPDPIPDDQALWARTGDGVVVVLGCAHAGVVNTLDYVAELAHTAHIHAIIGGMHLQNADERRLKATAKAFRRYQVNMLAPCHCTGQVAKRFLAREFPAEYVPCFAGAVFSDKCGSGGALRPTTSAA